MPKEEAFVLLQKFAENGKRCAKALPENPLSKKNWLGILFQLINKRWVLPLEEIQEVIYLPTATRISGMRGWFLGIGQLRGELLTLNDLQGLVYGVDSKIGNKSRVFVLRHEGELIGFVVDRLLGLIYASKQELDLKTQSISERDYYSIGRIKNAGMQYSVFSLNKILEKGGLWDICRTTRNSDI